MTTADLVIHGGQVVSPDSVIQASVAIHDGHIMAVGSEAAMPPAPPGGFQQGGSGSVDAVRSATSEAYEAALQSHPLSEIAATHLPDINALAKGVPVTDAQ